jgi:primary-amine oxidase
MRLPRQAVLLSAALPLCAAPVGAQQLCNAPYFVEQSFPTTGTPETTWRICWQYDPYWGLIITSAHFRKAPNAAFMRLFWDARVSEIFVPYHQGQPRYTDLQYGGGTVAMTATDCPSSAGGVILGTYVCKEVHDRGLLWKDYAAVRRGQELVLWSVLGIGGYNYVFQWTFRDDGTVIGRLGASGPSWGGPTHMHSAMWRLDIDLNGFWGDAVRLGTHTENLPSPTPGSTATDTDPVVATEQGLDWNDLNFNSADVHDATLTNGRGSPTSYHLMPLRLGTARHDEPFTQHDFWVTQYNWTEMRPQNLSVFVSQAASVSNADIVLWYWGSLHHALRDEDGQEVVTGNTTDWVGETLIMWAEFMLKPNNLFDTTPFFP